MEQEKIEKSGKSKENQPTIQNKNISDKLTIPEYIENKELFKKNIECLKDEINWLSKIITERLKEYNDGASEFTEKSVTDIQALRELPDCSYKDFINSQKLTYVDRLLLVLSMATDFSPQIVNQLLTGNTSTINRVYGGIVNDATGQFYPTLRTAIFLLGGLNFSKTTYYNVMLNERYHLFREQVLNLYHSDKNNNPYADPQVVLDPSYNEYLITGKKPRLDHGADFPAQLLETEKTFDDLI